MVTLTNGNNNLLALVIINTKKESHYPPFRPNSYNAPAKKIKSGIWNEYISLTISKINC